jgi:hypothetical protein
MGPGGEEIVLVECGMSGHACVYHCISYELFGSTSFSPLLKLLGCYGMLSHGLAIMRNRMAKYFHSLDHLVDDNSDDMGSFWDDVTEELNFAPYWRSRRRSERERTVKAGAY